MLRTTLRNWRVARRRPCQLCRLLAAMKDSGRARTMLSSVPQIAICRVSMAGAHNRGRMVQSGGTERARKSAICGMPLASSPQLSCAPPALHCSTQPRARARAA
ncbi:hypothetical protein D3C80_1945240 [compost metagenome]